jgi:glutamate racemase
MNASSEQSIGIFDSGFGGLTVMRAIRTVLPHENLIYFGDTARLPYGNKSAETILRYAHENAQFLLSKKIKLLVIACHTACAYALEEISKTFDVPVVGVIPPAVNQLIQLPKKQKVAILGTRGTIASGIYQSKIREILPQTEILAIACPLFVPLVEEGYTNHHMATLAIREYLSPLKDKGVDATLLGCTHYPLMVGEIQNELGAKVTLIDPGYACAREVGKLLHKNHLFNEQKETPRYEFFVSDDPDKFRQLGQTFLGCPIEHVQSI